MVQKADEEKTDQQRSCCGRGTMQYEWVVPRYKSMASNAYYYVRWKMKEQVFVRTDGAAGRGCRLLRKTCFSQYRSASFLFSSPSRPRRLLHPSGRTRT